MKINTTERETSFKEHTSQFSRDVKCKMFRLGLIFFWGPFALSKSDQENDNDNAHGFHCNQFGVYTQQCHATYDFFIFTQILLRVLAFTQKFISFESIIFIYVPPEIRHCYNSMKTLCSVRALNTRYVGVGEIYAVWLEWFFPIYEQCKVLGLVIEQCVVKRTSL